MPQVIASGSVSLAISMLWLTFVRRFDRSHPEPWSKVALTFLIGAGAVFVSAWTERLLIHSLGSQGMLAQVLAALVEEPIKLFVVVVCVGKVINEPVDGVVYSSVSALGFGAMENIHYFAAARMDPSLIAGRAFASVPLHVTASAIWGFAIGRRLVVKAWWLTPVALALSVSSHALYNIFLSERLAVPAVLLVLVLAYVFLAAIRKLLRRGQVDGPGHPSRDRIHMPLGIPWVARFGSIMFIILCGTLVGLAPHAFATKPLVSAILLGAACAVALVACGYLLTMTLPLDVAIDASGVTFAGRTLKWQQIQHVGRSEHYLEIAAADGALRLGPARDEDLKAVEIVLRATLPREAPRQT